MNDPFILVKLFLSDGEYHDALTEMRSLPKRARSSVPAIELYLRILTGLGKFELCEMATKALLDDLVPSDETLESIARFRLEQARSRLRGENQEGAKHSLRDALQTWPPIRAEVESDPELTNLGTLL